MICNRKSQNLNKDDLDLNGHFYEKAFFEGEFLSSRVRFLTLNFLS